MKKVLLVAVAGLFVLASCKKDYDCECTVTLFGTTTTSTTVLNGKKDDVKTACEGSNSALVNCKIK